MSTKVRVSNWINNETWEPQFGVQVKLKGDVWRHVTETGELYIVSNIEAAKAKRDEVIVRFAKEAVLASGSVS